MSEEGFHLFLGVMCVIALFVFIALYFVKAGYGCPVLRRGIFRLVIRRRGLMWKRLIHRHVWVVGEEWSGICRAGIISSRCFNCTISSVTFIFPFC